MAAARVPALDLAPLVIRKAAWMLPESMRMKEAAGAIDDRATGRVGHDYRGVRPGFHLVTGVREDGGVVYLGSFEERAVAYFSLPD